MTTITNGAFVSFQMTPRNQRQAYNRPGRDARGLCDLPGGTSAQCRPWSWQAFTFEAAWSAARPFRRDDVGPLVRALAARDAASRAPGKRTGALGYVGLKIAGTLAGFLAMGEAFPSYAELAARSRRSPSAVRTTLAALRAWGVIEWERRFVEAPTAGGKGPQVRQTSNVYRLAGAVADVVDGLLRAAGVKPSPIPDDETARQLARDAVKADYDRQAAALARAPLDPVALNALLREAARDPWGRSLFDPAKRLTERDIVEAWRNRVSSLTPSAEPKI
jgi:hypothetical protein